MPDPVVTPTSDPTVTILEPAKTEPTTVSTTETKPSQSTETKVESKVEPKDKSLLNEEDNKPPVGDAPEKYEAWKLPDGFEMPEAKLTLVNDTFKELGISQEAGQKLVDLYAGQLKEEIEAPYKAYTDLRKTWRDEVAADPKIGKILPQVKQDIARALDGIGDPVLVTAYKEAMDLTGAGDHPAFIKVLHALAQRAVEGKPVTGKGPAGVTAPGAKPTTGAAALYPNLPSAG